MLMVLKDLQITQCYCFCQLKAFYKFDLFTQLGLFINPLFACLVMNSLSHLFVMGILLISLVISIKERYPNMGIHPFSFIGKNP